MAQYSRGEAPFYIQKAKWPFAKVSLSVFMDHAVYIRHMSRAQMPDGATPSLTKTHCYTGVLAHNQYSALHHKNRCVPLAYQVLNFARAWRFPIADSRHRKRAAASQDGSPQAQKKCYTLRFQKSFRTGSQSHPRAQRWFRQPNEQKWSSMTIHVPITEKITYHVSSL